VIENTSALCKTHSKHVIDIYCSENLICSNSKQFMYKCLFNLIKHTEQLSKNFTQTILGPKFNVERNASHYFTIIYLILKIIGTHKNCPDYYSRCFTPKMYNITAVATKF